MEYFCHNRRRPLPVCLLAVVFLLFLFYGGTRSAVLLLNRQEAAPFGRAVYEMPDEAVSYYFMPVREGGWSLQVSLKSGNAAGGMPGEMRETAVLLLLLLFGSALVFELILYKAHFVFGDPWSFVHRVLEACRDGDGKKRRFSYITGMSVCMKRRFDYGYRYFCSCYLSVCCRRCFLELSSGKGRKEEG